MGVASSTALRVVAHYKPLPIWRVTSGGVQVMPRRVGDLFDHGIDEPRNRHLATPS
jgi:hypothetical protein